MDLFIKILLGAIVALLIALLIKQFILYLVIINSNSMLPTLKPENKLLTIRIYRFKRLNRGDIIVFYSREFKERMIKRLIGLPGDTIDINRYGEVSINKNKLDEPYIKFKGGPSGEFVVPENKYFVLGDNRKQSSDSRKWNEPYISKKDIKGKVIIR